MLPHPASRDHRTSATRALVGALLLLAPGGLAAQDGHYWTEQYGTRAHLLGGLVVGSARDLSTAHYNPGGVALLENPTALLALDAFQYDWLSVGDEVDQRLVRGSRFEPANGMVAVALPGRWVRGRRIALSILTRRRFRAQVQGADFEPILPPGDPGPGQSSSILVNQNYSEHWLGATWATARWGGWGIGITTNLALRTQRFDEQMTDARFSAVGAPASWSSNVTFSYWHLRLLWKAGVMYQAEGWSAGATVTTPSVGVAGGGDVVRSETYTGDVEGLFPGATPRVAASAGEGLDASVSSSWAVAAGASFDLGPRTRIHLTTEWFAPVEEQTVMRLPTFQSQVPGDTVATGVLHGLDAVLNAGVAIRHDLQSDLTLLGSFFTDFSGAANADQEIRTELSTWNLYHVTGGVEFDLLGSHVTLGLQLMRGERTRTADFLPPPVPGREQSEPVEGMARYNRIKVLIGLSLDLLGD